MNCKLIAENSSCPENTALTILQNSKGAILEITFPEASVDLTPYLKEFCLDLLDACISRTPWTCSAEISAYLANRTEEYRILAAEGFIDSLHYDVPHSHMGLLLASMLVIVPSTMPWNTITWCVYKTVEAYLVLEGKTDMLDFFTERLNTLFQSNIVSAVAKIDLHCAAAALTSECATGAHKD